MGILEFAAGNNVAVENFQLRDTVVIEYVIAV